MPKFSQSSFSKLSTCHSDLQVLFYEVIKSFDCTIIEGYRGQEEQDHAFSMAVDVSPYPIDWKNTDRFYFFAGYVMGIAQRLKDEGKISHVVRYGGDWNGNKNIDDERFKDLVHFELVQ